VGWVDLRIPQIIPKPFFLEVSNRMELAGFIEDGEPTPPYRAPLPGGDFWRVGLMLKYYQSIAKTNNEITTKSVRFHG
jgi:hypothetical protein